MTDRDRLIELLDGAEDLPTCQTYTGFADYLLANGVIVPPCKVGETLFFLYDNTFANRPNLTLHIYETNDWYFDVDQKGTSILPRSIRSYKGKHHYYLGKTVFLTLEEAERKLKELKK